jgi:hypothetical protein
MRWRWLTTEPTAALSHLLAVQWRLQKIDARYSFIVKIIISMQV